MSSSLFSLAGQTALITGASRGIGQAAAIALSDAGAVVVLIYRRGGTDRTTFNNVVGKGGSAVVVECNLDDMEDVKTVFPRALNQLADHGLSSEIHILVNCAGIQRRAPAIEFSESMWDEVIAVNLKSYWILCQAAGQHMVPLRRGKIINFCSLLTFQGGVTIPAYAAAKGAVGQLTKALSNEWSAYNVQVNGICPGYIETDMNSALLENPERLAQISVRIPAGRWGKPEDFAGPVLFLASSASSYVCGELLVVDGGWMGR